MSVRNPTRVHLHTGSLGLLALCLLLTGATAAAEDAPAPTLVPGLRVQIEAPALPPAQRIGTIQSIDARTIRMTVPGRAEPLDVARDQITRFRVSAGRSSRLAHTLVGGAIGAIGGAVLANHSGGMHFAEVTQASAAALGVVGAAIGSQLPAGERWTEVPAARYRLSFAPQLGAAFAVALSRAF